MALESKLGEIHKPKANSPLPARPWLTHRKAWGCPPVLCSGRYCGSGKVSLGSAHLAQKLPVVWFYHSTVGLSKPSRGSQGAAVRASAPAVRVGLGGWC